MTEIINHKELAISRLATQFRESTNLKAYIETLLNESDNLETVFQDLLEDRYVDTAVGAQLDIVGALVGQPRGYIDAILIGYFGFSPNPLAESFGTLSDPSVGGRFVSTDEIVEGRRLWTDTEYRIFIRARIIKNSTNSTPENIISQIKFLFPEVTQVQFQDGDTFYNVGIGGALDATEKDFLVNGGLVPKTAGVQVNYTIEYIPEEAFGFSGSGGLGFGTLSNPSVGGKFAKLL